MLSMEIHDVHGLLECLKKTKKDCQCQLHVVVEYIAYFVLRSLLPNEKAVT